MEEKLLRLMKQERPAGWTKDECIKVRGYVDLLLAENAALRADVERLAVKLGKEHTDAEILRAERDAWHQASDRNWDALEVLREIIRNALASGGVTHPATRMLEKAMEEK